VYWNEYMPALRQDLDPDSLEAHGQLIGWIPDTNVFYQPATSLAHYYNSMTGNPSIHIDNNNEIIVVWAGVTMLLDPSGYMLRHIFSRLGLVETGGVVFWDGSFWQNRDLTSDFLYNFAECMYPDISPNSTYSGGMGNGEYFVLFQADDIAGSYVKGTGIAGYQGQTSVSDNFMTMVKDSKLWYEGIDPHSVNLPRISVSANYPNPFKGITSIGVQTDISGKMSIDVADFMGRKVISKDYGWMRASSYRCSIDAGNLVPGIYLYTVRIGSESVTRKMMIE
ncbi:MAG: T9SS type A sorting domain-containing protein, partial [Bacteroidota bacterium]